MKNLFNNLPTKTLKSATNLAFGALGLALLSSLYINYDLYQQNKKWDKELEGAKKENEAVIIYSKKVNEIINESKEKMEEISNKYENKSKK